MGLAHEVVEAESNTSAAPAASRRPLYIALGVSGALTAVVAALAFREPTKTVRSEEGETSKILVPNHRATDELAQAAAIDAPRVSYGSEPGNLGVMQGPVPAVPVQYGGAPPQSYGLRPAEGEFGGAAAGLPGPGGGYEASAEAQRAAHALEVQRWQLELRKSSLAASSSAPAFAELRKERASEVSAWMKESRELEDEVPGAGAFLRAATPSLAMLSAARGMGGGGGAGFGSPATFGLGEGQSTGEDPHMAAQKLDFFRNGGGQLQPGELPSVVRRQSSPYVLLMGAVIPGVMVSGIHSEAPGQITGRVSQNVFDSASGSHLLVPQGSQLVGTYNAVVAQGQYRVQVAWVRLNFPDGSTLDLGGMSGADQAGTSGFQDKINLHFGRRLAAALMTSSFTVAYELTAPRSGSPMEGAVHRGVGESIVQLGADMARQEGKLPPTLEIRPGYRFVVNVSKDIRFPGPYDDGIDRDMRRRR